MKGEEEGKQKKIRYQSRYPIESSACECQEAIAAMSLSRFSFVVDSKLARGRGGKATQRMIRECVGKERCVVGETNDLSEISDQLIRSPVRSLSSCGCRG